MQIFTQEMRDIEYLRAHGKFENDLLPTWIAVLVGHIMGSGKEVSDSNVLMHASMIAFERELAACRNIIDVPDEFNGGAEQVLRYAYYHCSPEERKNNKIKRMISSLADAYRTKSAENDELKKEIACLNAKMATRDDVL